MRLEVMTSTGALRISMMVEMDLILSKMRDGTDGAQIGITDGGDGTRIGAIAGVETIPKGRTGSTETTQIEATEGTEGTPSGMVDQKE